MKLSQWAKRQGITYKTAHRWFHEGVLPARAIQTETGTILVEDGPETRGTGVALYARVSGSDQKADLDRQIARLVEYATEKKLAVTQTVSEVGSGLNGRRGKLIRLLRDPAVGTIIVEHRERLTRFGAEYLDAALSASGRKLVCVQAGELEDDLAEDMVDVLTSFSARLYGRRSARNRARRAVKAIREAK